MNFHKAIIVALPVLIFLAITGCATSKSKEAEPNDPWADWNKNTQAFNDSFDKRILKPVAKGYLHVTNSAVDDGVTHFFSNINDIGVTINDILQFKLLQGGMDISRFIINTTLGVAGIFDWASKFDLPKHNEDFGQTLGYWGVPSGPYLVLPFLGSSTPRDTVGLVGDALMDPITYVSIFGGFVGTAASAGSTALDVTDYRAGIMTNEKVVNEASNGDRYNFSKNAYFQHREYLISDGNIATDDDPLNPDGEDGRNHGKTSKTSADGSVRDLDAGSTPDNPNKMPTSTDKMEHRLQLVLPDKRK
jgi:phospholipid-binding lipoprotein MlaA